MNKKGFTLIELLAVIIILGILMLIAIPSVTTYINNSRKQTYVSTAKELVKGTTTLVNNGDLNLSDVDTTYYIPVSAIPTESSSRSPYGYFDPAYVAVTYDGDNYNYYWMSRDTEGIGVGTLVPVDKLTNESIITGIDKDGFEPNIGVDGRSKIVIFKDDLTVMEPVRYADINVFGETGEVARDYLCKRATILHTETCNTDHSMACGKNIGLGTVITYGNLKTSNKILPGDAFDCDVNGDEVFDPETERFYYITTAENGNAVLLYYNNFKDGQPNNTFTTAYYPTNLSYYGPVTAYKYLPTKSQWTNSKLVHPGVRSIVNELGTKELHDRYSGEDATIVDTFDYGDKAARLLTYSELSRGCNSINVKGDHALENCIFYMENSVNFLNDSHTSGDYWLETPDSTSDGAAFLVNGHYAMVRGIGTSHTNAAYTGVRPAIETPMFYLEH